MFHAWGYATRAATPQELRREAWQTIHVAASGKRPAGSPIWPLTCQGIQAAVVSIMASGYRSVDNYWTHAKVEHVACHAPRETWLSCEVKNASKSARRGIGAAHQSAEPPRIDAFATSCACAPCGSATVQVH